MNDQLHPLLNVKLSTLLLLVVDFEAADYLDEKDFQSACSLDHVFSNIPSNGRVAMDLIL